MQWWSQAQTSAEELGFCSYDHITDIAEKLPDQYLGINAVDWHPSAALHRVYGEKLASYAYSLLITRQCSKSVVTDSINDVR
jgi:hypothetical protein